MMIAIHGSTGRSGNVGRSLIFSRRFTKNVVRKAAELAAVNWRIRSSSLVTGGGSSRTWTTAIQLFINRPRCADRGAAGAKRRYSRWLAADRRRKTVDPHERRFRSENDLLDANFLSNGRLIRLRDIAEVRRALADPPQPMFRVNGKPAIGLALPCATAATFSALETMSKRP